MTRPTCSWHERPCEPYLPSETPRGEYGGLPVTGRIAWLCPAAMKAAAAMQRHIESTRPKVRAG